MAAPGATALASRSEALAAKLPPLLIAAERVAATVAQGVHGRRRVGLGESFWQFRSYEPGDPPQRIDWRQSAKSDRVFIRQTEWEAAQSAWLWRDGSPSMRYRSAPTLPEKRERAEVLVVVAGSAAREGPARVGHHRDGQHETVGVAGLRPALREPGHVVGEGDLQEHGLQVGK